MTTTPTTRRPVRATPEERQHALTLYAEHGLAHAHHETGVAKSTLRCWATDAGLNPAELAGASRERTDAANAAREARCDEMRLELREKFLLTALAMLERVDDAAAGACQHFVTSAAVAIDKYRLEVGEVTVRTELTGRAPEVEERIAHLVEMRSERAS